MFGDKFKIRDECSIDDCDFPIVENEGHLVQV